MSETEYPEPDPSLSSDATHSTYKPAELTEEEQAQNPPPGPAVVQEKGKPKDVGSKSTASSKSKASES